MQEHSNARRQAIADDLTGLTTHGHFQELLGAEMEEVRRYTYPVGLVMIDIDDFKAVNDSYGHQQSDRPHTELDSTYTIAERVRTSIVVAEIPLMRSNGVLRVTASLGVAAATGADKNRLITAADTALYLAEREGKNRTVRGGGAAADILRDPLRPRGRSSDLAPPRAGCRSPECGRDVYYAVRHGSPRRRNPRASRPQAPAWC